MRLSTPSAQPLLGPLLVLCAASLSAAASSQQPRFERLSREGFAPAGQSSRCAAAFDANGDGLLDVFFGNEQQSNRLYLATGVGTFVEAPSSALPAIPPGVTLEAVAGDLDGDGDVDLLLARDFPNLQNRLLLNNGTGRFVDATARLPQNSGRSRSLDLGDVDGDGDLDVLVANFNQPDLLLVNDGRARFSVAGPARFPATSLFSEVGRWIDVDADGDLDAVIGLTKGGSVTRDRLYLNDGTGTFQDISAATLPALGSQTDSIAAGDFDGDGTRDLFLAQAVGEDLLLLNDGTNAFVRAPASMFPRAVTVSLGCVAADFDGDQDLDLAVGTGRFPGNGIDRLYLNDGSGQFTLEEGLPRVSVSTQDLLCDDFDGNGTPDLLVVQWSTPSRLLFNDGTATFENSVQERLPETYEFGRNFTPADVDGDGDLDCLVANGANNFDQLLLNDGNGYFEDASARLPNVAAGPTLRIACGDMDADGDPDVFVARYGQNFLWRNDGAAGFVDVTASHLPTAATDTNHAVWFDADGDRDLDLVTAEDRRQNTLLLNDGSGRMTDASFGRMPVEQLLTTFVDPVDVDGDGDLDLVVAHRPFNGLYLNDGAGFFFDAGPRYLPVSSTARTVTIAHGDVDGDGDDDLMLGGRFGTDELYLNDGAGKFTDASATHVRATRGGQDEVQLVDLDADGDLDALRGGGAIWLNDGQGVFTDAPTGEFPELGASNAVADLDRDGDPDVLSQNGVHVNLRRQLASTVPSRLRGVLRLRAFARRGAGQAPSTFFPLLAAGRLPSPTPVPGLGNLQLDLRGLVVALPPISVTQPNGDGTASLPLPADPSLTGLDLFLQAAELGGTTRLTNLVADRIRG